MRKNYDPDVLSQAFGEPSRRALLENLRYGQKTVTQLVEATQLKQPNVSNHLAKMRQQDIVRAERIGRQVYYSLSMPFADVMLRMLEYAAHPLADDMSVLPANDLDATAGQEHTNGASRVKRSPHRAGVNAEPSAQNIEQWRSAYFNAMMAGDEDKAATLVNALLAQKLPLETIYIQVFQWGVNHVGEMFQKGMTDEAHEHMASSITERMMTRVAQYYTPLARTARRAILGCVAGNWHILGIRMLSDGLKGMGWDTIFLGANVPTPSFVSLAQTMQPDLVILSCAMEEQGAEARTLLARLNGLRREETGRPFQIARGRPLFP